MDHSDVIRKLSEILNDDSNLGKACHEIAADIKKRHSRLLELVEGLHEPLTDTRPNIRERGVRILVDVLCLLPGDFLTENELTFILRFFTDRLKDHHSVVPTALRGILSIGYKSMFTAVYRCTRWAEAIPVKTLAEMVYEEPLMIPVDYFTPAPMPGQVELPQSV